MGANPHANGGILLSDLVMPDFRQYGVEVHKPGGTAAKPPASWELFCAT